MTRYKGGSALDQVEQAIDLLKQLPAEAWVQYLLGAVPITLACLWFARDMMSGFAAGRCLPDSLACAAVFWFAAFWKARFSWIVALRMEGASGVAEPHNSTWQCVFLQGLLQTLKLAVLPLALISILPLPWVSALFRGVSIEVNRQGATLSSTLRRAAAQASSGGRANWLAFLICAGSGLVLFVNVFAMCLLLPQLLKSFTGWESDWTRNAGLWANGNVFRVAVAVTFLLLDPLLQACAAVRLFYYQAGTDGRDILVRLRRLPVTLMMAALLACAGATNAAELSASDVHRGVAKVTRHSDYDWLRATKADGGENGFGDRLVRDVRRAVEAVGGWMKALGRWIESLFSPRSEGVAKPKQPAKAPAMQMQWLLYGLAGVLAIATVVLLMRTWQKPKMAPSATTDAPGPVEPIDVTADLLGSERADDEWLAAAREHALRGELRLAIRAMYLSNLAHLGSLQLIQIKKSKSNGVYERELRIRCRAESIRGAFAKANRAYESVWYGAHEATPELHTSFQLQVQAMRSGAPTA